MSWNFEIGEIVRDKRDFLPLLLMGDESEAMIGRYLAAGRLYAGYCDGFPMAVCVCLGIGHDVVEVKNLAVHPDFRRMGYGRLMLEFAERMNPGKTLILGTGETPSTLRFYRSCGFRYYRRVPGFFTDNYPQPIVEEGVLLRDMIYLKKVPSLP